MYQQSARLSAVQSPIIPVVAELIRDTVRSEAGDEAADGIRILYGGSVNAGNIKGFMAKRHVDGALVGGAALDPDGFAAIVRYWV